MIYAVPPNVSLNPFKKYFDAFAVLMLAGALSLAGCGRGNEAGNSVAATTGPTVSMGNGTIRGRVILTGPPPELKPLIGSPGATDESIVIGPGSGLKNVIVFLKDAPRTDFVLPEPAVIDQKNCVYVPHVIALRTGQTLRLKSSDAMLHNVHLKCSVNPDTNRGFPGPGQQDVILSQPEPPFQVKCDVHPWMTAWIGVFDHPWFAVTRDDGQFVIEHVPPGTYTLVAWQESLPEQEQQVTVKDAQPVEAGFTFAAP